MKYSVPRVFDIAAVSKEGCAAGSGAIAAAVCSAGGNIATSNCDSGSAASGHCAGHGSAAGLSGTGGCYDGGYAFAGCGSGGSPIGSYCLPGTGPS